MFMRYGLYANPKLSHRVNLRNHVLSLPISTLDSRISNAACHNLCTTLTPPRLLKSLLGLGLKFCPHPQYTTSTTRLSQALLRFETDFWTKVLFADVPTGGSDWSPKQLYVRNDVWNPKQDVLALKARTDAFRKQITPWFYSRKAPSNLTRIQQRLLITLRHNPDFIVLNSDKNLGPVIIERETYVRRCLLDHLLVPRTYEHLSFEAAEVFTLETKDLLQSFLRDHKAYISDLDLKYLERTLAMVTDKYAYFYALAKVHKSPWKTRPIVSVSGSLLFGLGKWLDQQLQPIIRQLPTYLPSSFQLKTDLDKMAGTDFSRMSLFTGDVVAMYPSISLPDAFQRIHDFLRQSPLCPCDLVPPIMDALTLIMKRNCFRFGDTYWLQKDGTAMGTPPAPSFATLYYGIFEIDLLEQFRPSLRYLRRYIDDQFGIWIHDPDPTIDRQRWEAFQQCQQEYCSLDWEFSKLSKTANFLDLTLDVDSFHINFKLYEKPLNLHLYIPPNSAHTPSVRTGLVNGGVFRILKLTTKDRDKTRSLSKFHSHLLARGYKPSFLRLAFEQALQEFSKSRKTPITTDSQEPIFLHLPFHPRDPTRSSIQRAFHTCLLRPNTKQFYWGRANNHHLDLLRTHTYDAFAARRTQATTFHRVPLLPSDPFEPYLYEMKNKDGFTIKMKRLVVAYSRAPNLKNLLFPRHVESKCPTARLVSTIHTELVPDTSTNTEQL